MEAGSGVAGETNKREMNTDERRQIYENYWDLQKRTGEIEDSRKNIINVNYFNAVTSARLASIGLDSLSLDREDKDGAGSVQGSARREDQSQPFSFGANNSGSETNPAMMSARVMIYNKDGIQQTNALVKQAGQGLYPSNNQTNTTSGQLQPLPYPQSPTLQDAQPMPPKRVMKTLNAVASFGETLAAQHTQEVNLAANSAKTPNMKARLEITDEEDARANKLDIRETVDTRLRDLREMEMDDGHGSRNVGGMALNANSKRTTVEAERDLQRPIMLNQSSVSDIRKTETSKMSEQ